MIKKAFGVSVVVLDYIKDNVMQAWDTYAVEQPLDCIRIREEGLPNDHVAVQAGLAVYKMRDPINGLTKAQRERIEMLAEEAAEVVQACTKILRHGYHSYHPDEEKLPVFQRTNNRANLHGELIQFWTIYEKMVAENDLERINFYGTDEIWKKKLKYTHHQGTTMERKENQ